MPGTAGWGCHGDPGRAPHAEGRAEHGVTVSLATSSRGTKPGQGERPGLSQPCLEPRHTCPGQPFSAQKHPTFEKRNKGIETPKVQGGRHEDPGSGWSEPSQNQAQSHLPGPLLAPGGWPSILPTLQNFSDFCLLLLTQSDI